MELQKINTLIFDFDGTLADTLPLAYYSFQTVFNHYDGKAFSDEEVKNMFGPTEPNIIRNNLINDNQQSAIDLYFNMYTENHQDMVKANAKVNDMLKTLKEKGYNLAIVTGKSTKSLEISLEFLGIQDLFDCKISGDDVDKEKPDPEGILKVLKLLNRTKEEAVFLGDSDGDIKAGQEAGMYAIGVHWIPNVQNTTFNIEPDAIFKDVDELMNVLSVSS